MRTSVEQFQTALTSWTPRGLWSDDYQFYNPTVWGVERGEEVLLGAALILTIDGGPLHDALNHGICDRAWLLLGIGPQLEPGILSTGRHAVSVGALLKGSGESRATPPTLSGLTASEDGGLLRLTGVLGKP